MRLSSILSDSSKSYGEIESFINFDKYTILEEEANEDITLISSGDFIEIQVGKIILSFFSTICRDSTIFESPQKLHCLIVNQHLISIDCELKCIDFDADNDKCKVCTPYVQAWFLIESDDIYANTPKVKLIKQNYKLPDHIRLPIETQDTFSELLGKAEIAYKERLGAGSIIYLRAAFEKLTHQVAKTAGVKTMGKNDKTIPFRNILEAVDAQCSIIPAVYSQNGHALFSKLSEIAHGNSDEATALKEYEALRRLVIGIIENVKKKNEEIENNKEIQKALNAIGFSEGGEEDE